MRRNINSHLWKSVLSIVIFIGFINPIRAQVDSVKAVKTDTTIPKPVDTAKAASVDTTAKPQATKEKKAKKNEFILYGGANLNQLNVSSSQLDASSSVGYHFGIAFKQGSFFYWQAGARFNSAQYKFLSKASSADTAKLTVQAIDIPLTAGINFLSFANRLIALRAFVSAVPSFTVGVGDNKLNVTKSDINSFVFYGQAGIGANIAFVLVDIGYNFGFQDLLKNVGSKPGQAFLSLGFRF
jgi:hypothetical protein